MSLAEAGREIRAGASGTRRIHLASCAAQLAEPGKQKPAVGGRRRSLAFSFHARPLARVDTIRPTGEPCARVERRPLAPLEGGVSARTGRRALRRACTTFCPLTNGFRAPASQPSWRLFTSDRLKFRPLLNHFHLRPCQSASNYS